MNFKPGDLLIGVIDFFGIVVPGAVLLFLHGELLAKPLGLSLEPGQTSLLFAFFVGSYVIGHVLLGLGVPLNKLLRIYSPERQDKDYQAIKGKIDLPHTPKTRKEEEERRTNSFYRAYAFVRMESPAALSEIERQMADYKLFRSLIIVFGIDLILAAICGVPDAFRFLISGSLFIIAAWRFLFLLDWTYRITFEYYALLKENR